jgi:hypothetical protein
MACFILALKRRVGWCLQALPAGKRVDFGIVPNPTIE